MKAVFDRQVSNFEQHENDGNDDCYRESNLSTRLEQVLDVLEPAVLPYDVKGLVGKRKCEEADDDGEEDADEQEHDSSVHVLPLLLVLGVVGDGAGDDGGAALGVGLLGLDAGGNDGDGGRVLGEVLDFGDASRELVALVLPVLLLDALDEGDVLAGEGDSVDVVH